MLYVREGKCAVVLEELRCLKDVVVSKRKGNVNENEK